jgi:hypothetical protein
MRRKQSKQHNRAISKGIRRKWRDAEYRKAQLKERELRFGKLESLDMYAGFTDTEFFVFVTREWQRIKAEEKKAELQ